MSFHYGFCGTQKYRPAVVVVVHGIFYFVHFLFAKQRPKFGGKTAHQRTFKQFHQLQTGSLGGFQKYVAGKSVAHHKVKFPRKQVAAFHVAHKVDGRSVFQQRIGFLAQSVPFFLFDANVKQCHFRVLHAVCLLHVQTSHYGKLLQIDGVAVYVCAAVANPHNTTRHCWQNGAEGRSFNATNTPHTQHCACKQRSRGAKAYHCSCRAVGTQQFETFAHGTVSFGLYCFGGFVVAGNDVGCMNNGKSLLVVLFLFKQLFQLGLISHKHNFHVVNFIQRFYRSADINYGAVVATVGIHNNFNHFVHLCFILAVLHKIVNNRRVFV